MYLILGLSHAIAVAGSFLEKKDFFAMIIIMMKTLGFFVNMSAANLTLPGDQTINLC